MICRFNYLNGMCFEGGRALPSSSASGESIRGLGGVFGAETQALDHLVTPGHRKLIREHQRAKDGVPERKLKH